jgi:hypothetical protein
LLGTDNNGGPGGTSIYYWVSSISSYAEFSVSVKVQQVVQAGGTIYMGVVLLQSAEVGSRLYEIDVYVSGTTGYLEIRYYSGAKWTRLYRSSQTFLVDGSRWFIMLINYSRDAATTTNTISAAVYDVNGNQLASGSVQIGGNRYFVPSYVGVSVNSATGSGAQARFDDFVFSLGNPRYLLVEGLPPGYRVELYDDEGRAVAEATSGGGVTRLDILKDLVVGRGLGASFKIYDSGGNPCLSNDLLVGDAVVGGDSYRILLHVITVNLSDSSTRADVGVLPSPYSPVMPETRVLGVINQDLKPYYVGLIFYPNQSVVSQDLDLVIELTNGTLSTALVIDGGSLPSQPVITDLLKVLTSANVSVSVSKGSGTQSALFLELVYCNDPVLRGVCVYYPIKLEV